MKLSYKKTELGLFISSNHDFKDYIEINKNDRQFRHVITNDEDRHDINDELPYYNIGNMLELPKLFKSKWKYKYNMLKLHKEFPNTIVNYYYDSFNTVKGYTCPSNTHIIAAVKKYISSNNLMTIFNEINSDDTLFIHVRAGDIGPISSKYLTSIRNLVKSKKYKKYIILLGAHSNWHRIKSHKAKGSAKDANAVFKNFETTITSINNISKDIEFFMSNADTHVSLMYVAKNLLIHKGTFSYLGYLINPNNVFYTEEMDIKLSKKKGKRI